MFNSVICSNGLTLTSCLICVISSILLGLIISFIHIKSGKNSKNFIITLTLLPLLVATVMIMVNKNLGTGVAIAGAFSLIRFRSIPGTSREIISVFWAMAVGIAIGMGQIFFATIVTLVVGLIMFILNTSKYGENRDNEKILEIQIPEDLEYDTMFNEVFNKFTNNYELIKTKTTNLGSLYELKYMINLKHDVSEKHFIDELRILNGNLKICLHKEDREDLL